MTTFTQEDFDILQAMLLHDSVKYVLEALDVMIGMNPPLELWFALYEMEYFDTYEEWVEVLKEGSDIPHHHTLMVALLGAMVTQGASWVADVKHVLLMNANLSAVPEWIKEFTNLESLNLSYNLLSELSDDLLSLPLRELTCVDCGLTSLPKGMNSVQHLRLLNLTENDLKELPRDLFQIESLEILSVRNNNIQFIPEGWTCEGSLKHFDVTLNPMQSIPESLRGCSVLKELLISGCALSVLPNWIGELRSLEMLVAGGNGFVSLPDSVVYLTSLKHLGIWDCALTHLPDSIGDMIGLEEVSLAYNNLSVLPDSIVELSLERLNLDHNPLTDLPAELRVVKLDAQQVVELSSKMQSWVGLRRLDLRDTELSALPSGIQYLTNLQELWLQENALTSIPEWVGALSSLSTLNLWQNPLESLPGNLTTLTLDIEQFIDFQDVLPMFSQLRHLGVVDNTMIVLPSEIRHLTQVTSFDFRGNDLVHLPDWLGEMSDVEEVLLTGNPIEFELLEAFHKQYSHIRLVY